MSYLENFIRKTLKSEGYFCTKSIHDIAREIEEKNDCTKDLYSVHDWIVDNRSVEPKVLFKQSTILDKATTYLLEQKEKCFEQTGCTPTIEDYEVCFTSEEFVDRVGYELSIEEFISYMIEYYVDKENIY